MYENGPANVRTIFAEILMMYKCSFEILGDIDDEVSHLFKFVDDIHVVDT